MNSYQIQKRREKRFLITCLIIFTVTLIVGTRGERKDKYKIYPHQIIKAINDNRESN